MNHIQSFLALCHVKNELNRKRRRWYHWAFVHRLIGEESAMRYSKASMYTNPYSKDHAASEYERAKKDMKSLTPQMRQMRKSIGAKTKWNSSGMIAEVVIGDRRIHHSKFKAAYVAEMFESEFFKSETK